MKSIMLIILALVFAIGCANIMMTATGVTGSVHPKYDQMNITRAPIVRIQNVNNRDLGRLAAMWDTAMANRGFFIDFNRPVLMTEPPVPEGPDETAVNAAKKCEAHAVISINCRDLVEGIITAEMISDRGDTLWVAKASTMKVTPLLISDGVITDRGWAFVKTSFEEMINTLPKP